MDSLMYLMRQGDIADQRRIAQLERRVDELEKMFENMAKTLQSEQRPKMGRPPKVKDEPRQTEVDH
jgi:nitrogen fixation/metabolism regulation signal transduction histidine kinase